MFKKKAAGVYSPRCNPATDFLCCQRTVEDACPYGKGDPCLLRDLWAKIPFYIFGIPIVIAVVLIENTPFKEKSAYSDTFS